MGKKKFLQSYGDGGKEKKKTFCLALLPFLLPDKMSVLSSPYGPAAPQAAILGSQDEREKESGHLSAGEREGEVGKVSDRLAPSMKR